jgi:hypothetical protein
VVRRSVATLALALTLTGCADDAAPAEPVAWPKVAEPVGATTLSWANGSTIHRYGAEPIDVGAPVLGYAMAGEGYLAILDTGSKQTLHHVGLDDTSTDLGITLPLTDFGASPDGRFLAYVDQEAGDTDDHGTHLWQMVVVDLHTGEEIVRSSSGFGDTDDDLAVTYENYEVGFAGITDEAAYFTTLDGDVAVDLSDGTSSSVPEDEDAWAQPTYAPAQNPTGDWEILQNPGRGTPGHLRSDNDRRLDLDPGHDRWWLAGWIDDGAVLGETEDADGAWSYFACTVPGGECDDLDGSRWEENTPARVYPVNRLVYSSSQCCESD